MIGVFLHYCSPKEFAFRALLNICLTAGLVQYRRFIPALETSSSVVLTLSYGSQSLAVSANNL